MNKKYIYRTKDTQQLDLVDLWIIYGVSKNLPKSHIAKLAKVQRLTIYGRVNRMVMRGLIEPKYDQNHNKKEEEYQLVDEYYIISEYLSDVNEYTLALANSILTAIRGLRVTHS